MKHTFWRLLYRLALRAEWLMSAVNCRGTTLLYALRLQDYATARERAARQ
jgi:hypothetical protein